MLGDSHTYFTFVSHFSFTSMNPLAFGFSTMKLLLQFINILHLATIIVLSHQWQLMYSCLVGIFLFPYLCQSLLKSYTHESHKYIYLVAIFVLSHL